MWKGSISMQYISYAFHLDTLDRDKQLRDIYHILSILEERIYESSEVLITSEDLSFKSDLEDLLKSKEDLNTTSISILTPDKRSKLFTKTTLAVDAFFGDRLIYTRSSNEMLQFLRSYYKDRDNDHLIWIENSDLKRKTNRNEIEYYQELNRSFKDHVIPRRACGFSISRQVANSIDSSEFDYYDVFTALAISTFSKDSKTLTIDRVSHSSVYSDSDILELKAKFLKVSYFEFEKSPTTALAECVLFVVFLIASVLLLNVLLAILASICLILFVIDIVTAQNERLTVIARQSLAAANRKRIAGNFIRTIVNEK